MAKAPTLRDRRRAKPTDVFRRPWEWSSVPRDVAGRLAGREPIVVVTNHHAEWFRAESPLYRGGGSYTLRSTRYYRYVGTPAARSGGVTKPKIEAKPPPEEAPAPAEPARQLTWIEIKLVDVEGRPLGDQDYRIELAGGGVRTGRLDASGRVRIEGIDPGECKVSFPTLRLRTARA